MAHTVAGITELIHYHLLAVPEDSAPPLRHHCATIRLQNHAERRELPNTWILVKVLVDG